MESRISHSLADFAPPPGQPRRLPRLLLSVAALIAAPVGYVVLTGHHLATQAATGRVAPVPADEEVRPVGRQRSTIVAIGKVEPVNGERFLCFDTSGTLRRVFVEEGQRVRRGQPLAELINDELAARVTVSEHDLEVKAARLLLLEHGPRQEDIDEARADFESLSISSVYHERLLKTRRGLRPGDAVSREELADYQFRYDDAVKRKQASAARLHRLLAGTRAEEIDQARADKAVAAARLAEAKAAFERTRLAAPSDGSIVRLLRREGEAVVGAELVPFALLADSSRLQVRAEIDEDQIMCIEPGLAARVLPRCAVARPIEGKVVRLMDRMGRKQITTDDPREKVDTRVLEVIVSLPEGTGFRLHQRVDVTFTIADSAGR